MDDDAFSHLRVSDWSLVSADEYAVPFPLLTRWEVFPAPLRSHLEDCVAVRRWRVSTLAGGTEAPSGRVADLSRTWFADDSAMRCLLRRLGLLHMSRLDEGRERVWLALLESILAEVSRGRVPAWDSRSEAGFAFASGIHPAYLWAESGISTERGYAAAWLGYLDRGRAALMPTCVADYMLDAVVGPSGMRDADLAELADGVLSRPALRRAAERRRMGSSPIVRPHRKRLGLALTGGAAEAAPKEITLERA